VPPPTGGGGVLEVAARAPPTGGGGYWRIGGVRQMRNTAMAILMLTMMAIMQY